MKTKIPVQETIRFTFSNLTKHSWMYLRNSLFFTAIYLRLWIWIIIAYF